MSLGYKAEMKLLEENMKETVTVVMFLRKAGKMNGIKSANEMTY